MTKHYATLTAIVATSLATMALGACSHSTGNDTASSAANATTSALTHAPRHPAQKNEVSTPAAAPVAGRGDMRVVGSQNDKQYLYDLMQQPDFSSAFDAMEGADELPDWVRKGGTATPAETVRVDGQAYVVAQACKPHDCPSEQVVLLYAKDSHSMQGAFVTDPAPTADAGISDQAQWRWLGQPDDAAKAWLKNRLTSR